MDTTSGLSTTQPKSTLQNWAILRFKSSDSGCSVRQTRTSGWIPICISSRTECWVGLVLSSAVAAMKGTRVRWMNRVLSRPTSWRNWRIASRNGSDSMSPTVPPTSVRSEEHTLNSSHGYISYAVFCLKKKKTDYSDRLLDLVMNVYNPHYS